jgi:hypothetical protein
MARGLASVGGMGDIKSIEQIIWDQSLLVRKHKHDQRGTSATGRPAGEAGSLMIEMRQ